MNSMRKIIVTGKPGSGKTTLVKRVAERIPGARGFVTEEMREGRRRVGFKIVSSDGSEAVLARAQARPGPREGKYAVDVEAFERIAVPLLRESGEKPGLIYIDEIGKMELLSESFAELVWAVIESCGPLLATMGEVAHPLTERIRRRPDVEIIELKVENRDRLAAELVRRLAEG